jgi:hypothetical protein
LHKNGNTIPPGLRAIMVERQVAERSGMIGKGSMARTKFVNRSVKIPAGRYLSLAQVAQRRGVYPQTVLYWVNHHWLPSIRIPGLGYIVEESDLKTFTPPPRGRRQSEA